MDDDDVVLFDNEESAQESPVGEPVGHVRPGEVNANHMRIGLNGQRIYSRAVH